MTKGAASELSAALALRGLGIADLVAVAARDERRLELAEETLGRAGIASMRLRRRPEGEPVDGAVVWDPDAATLEAALAALRPGGTLIVIGAPPPGFSIDAGELVLAEIEVQCLAAAAS